MDYIKYPPSVKVLIEELIRISDAYYARKLSEENLRSIVHIYAKTSGDKLFSGTTQFNPTVVQRMGKRRIKLIEMMLDGCQIQLL